MMIKRFLKLILQITKRQLYLGLALIGGLAALLTIRACGKEGPAPGPLQPDEQARVEVKGRKVRITTRKGTVEKFIPDTAVVTVKDTGAVDVKVKAIGLKYELGGGVGVSSKAIKLLVDSRVAYAWRLSLHFGVTMDPKARTIGDVFRGTAFVAVPLPFDDFLPNTSIWLGPELPGPTWIGGLRVRF